MYKSTFFAPCAREAKTLLFCKLLVRVYARLRECQSQTNQWEISSCHQCASKKRISSCERVSCERAFTPGVRVVFQKAPGQPDKLVSHALRGADLQPGIAAGPAAVRT